MELRKQQEDNNVMIRPASSAIEEPMTIPNSAGSCYQIPPTRRGYMTVTELARSSRRPSGTLGLSALLVLSLIGAGSTGAPAGYSAGPAAAGCPRTVGGMAAPRGPHRHYARERSTTGARPSMIACRPRCTSATSNSLDGQRSYFLASDMAEFDQLESCSFDNMIQSGNNRPAFVMYARLQQQRNRRHRARTRSKLLGDRA